MKDKFGYLPPDKRKKILLICDDIRVHSGIATVAREIVIHTAHHFNWVNIAGAVQHPDKGKRLDLSEDTNKNSGIADSSVVLYPVDGYGDSMILRQLLEIEKPDAIMLITDPRYFVWLFAIENEIRKTTPIVYLNIWDDYPAPIYNKPYYEACDLLMGISKQTVNINKIVLGDKAKNKLIKYVPHGLNSDIFKPITKEDADYNNMIEFKKRIFNKQNPEFVVFFNSRNIRRKQIPDAMMAFRLFLDKLPKEQAKKCTMLLHTERASEHGTDSDVQILLTSNEGWGLSLTEAILCGLPIIANVTGGMQDQMRFEFEDGTWIDFDENFPSNHRGTIKKHGEWAFPVYPTSRSIVGSVPTPYIFDDRCEPEDATEQIMSVYNLTPEERKSKGLKGREWALSDEAGFTSEYQAKRVMENIDELFNTWTPRDKFEFINTNEYPKRVLKHKLIY
jgi:glycosyltransferase involved in cell wall biosynthesis